MCGLGDLANKLALQSPKNTAVKLNKNAGKVMDKVKGKKRTTPPPPVPTKTNTPTNSLFSTSQGYDNTLLNNG